MAMGILIGLAGSTLGCRKERKEPPSPFLPDVQIDERTVGVFTGPVGAKEAKATYVLLNAQNNAKRDLEVTVGGDLIDAAGKMVARLLFAVAHARWRELRTLAGNISENAGDS